jgi:hypothetical protein
MAPPSLLPWQPLLTPLPPESSLFPIAIPAFLIRDLFNLPLGRP